MNKDKSEPFDERVALEAFLARSLTCKIIGFAGMTLLMIALFTLISGQIGRGVVAYSMICPIATVAFVSSQDANNRRAILQLFLVCIIHASFWIALYLWSDSLPLPVTRDGRFLAMCAPLCGLASMGWWFWRAILSATPVGDDTA